MKNCKYQTYSLAIMIAMAGTASGAHAQDSVWDKEKWRVSVGAAAMYGPKYEGSDETEVEALPYIDIEWNDLVFLNPDQGLGIYLYNREPLEISASIGYEQGRQESDDRKNLKGMGDIDGAATANLSIEYELGPVSPYIEFSQHLGGTDGLVIDMGAETMIPLSGSPQPQNFDDGDDDFPSGPALRVGVATQWADDNYMSDHFGVTAIQATRSGKLKKYTASAGFKSVGAEVGLMYPVTDHWTLNFQVEYSRLMGDAADSPIVKEKNQLSAGMFVSYTF